MKLSAYQKTKLLLVKNPKKSLILINLKILMNQNNLSKRKESLKKLILKVLMIPNTWDVMNGINNNGSVKPLNFPLGLFADKKNVKSAILASKLPMEKFIMEYNQKLLHLISQNVVSKHALFAIHASDGTENYGKVLNRYIQFTLNVA